ncbi:MAG: serine/threonine protein kinase [Anaerolineae bacterium]|nr:serine/threonine protein kinase [Anaerolineae bacterium]
MTVDLKPGAKVKNYTLERQLGKGASGEVWKAYDSQKTVAIKFMNENLMSSPSAAKHRARLEREIEAMRRLQHPNIPTLFDYDLDFVRPYIAMRFVGGDAYDKLIASGEMLRVPLERRLDLIRELTFALEAAHDYGIVHRDIKPANITGIENPFLLDFSVALEREEADATQRFIGTTLYMSPDGEVDRLSDNYSFALVTYEMLFGKHPIYKPGDQIFNQYVAQERLDKGDWRWPSRIPPAEVPQDLRNANLQLLDTVFNRAFGKRETRYKDLRDFTRDLRDAIFPEMKTVIPAAQEDYIPTMMMEAVPVTPPAPPAPVPAPAQPAAPAASESYSPEGGTLVVPIAAAQPPAAPPPAPAQPAAEYDIRTVPSAEHKTVPYDSLQNAEKQAPPAILKTELDAPAAAPSAAYAAPMSGRTELETPAATAPAQPAQPAQAAPNYTMMEFQTPAPAAQPQGQPPPNQGGSYTMMEFQAAAPPQSQPQNQGGSYTMMEFQAAAPPQSQPQNQAGSYTMMEFQAAGSQQGQQPAAQNYTMMQMQAAPGGMYGKLQTTPKKKRSLAKIILLLALVVLAILFVVAVVLIATGTVRIGG